MRDRFEWRLMQVLPAPTEPATLQSRLPYSGSSPDNICFMISSYGIVLPGGFSLASLRHGAWVSLNHSSGDFAGLSFGLHSPCRPERPMRSMTSSCDFARLSRA